MVLCHFSGLLFPGAPSWFTKETAGLANFVGFFFVLSGFILAYTYQAKFQDGKTTVREFLGARFARIYPACIFALAVALPSFLFINVRLHVNSLELGLYCLASMVLVKSWIPFYQWPGISPWNGPMWSIETEFFFYLCFPFLIKPLGRLSSRGNLNLFVACALTLTLLGLAYDFRPGHTANEPFTGAFELIHSSPYVCILEFIMGIVLFNWSTNLSATTIELLRSKAPAAGVVLVIAYLAGNLWLPEISVFHGIPSVIFSLAILFSFVSESKAKGLSHPVMVYLGEISYSLYLLHIPVRLCFDLLSKIIHPLQKLQVSLSPVYALTMIFVSGGLAAFCYRFVEDPYRRKLRAYFARM